MARLLVAGVSPGAAGVYYAIGAGRPFIFHSITTEAKPMAQILRYAEQEVRPLRLNDYKPQGFYWRQVDGIEVLTPHCRLAVAVAERLKYSFELALTGQRKPPEPPPKRSGDADPADILPEIIEALNQSPVLQSARRFMDRDAKLEIAKAEEKRQIELRREDSLRSNRPRYRAHVVNEPVVGAAAPADAVADEAVVAADDSQSKYAAEEAARRVIRKRSKPGPARHHVRYADELSMVKAELQGT